MSGLTIKLSRFAAFNSIALVLQQVAVMLVSFIITPLLISSIGVSAFGVWQLLVKWSSYLVYLDGRSHENLKWKVSRIHDESTSERRQLVGAGLIIWLTFLPLMLIGSGCFLFYSNQMDSNGQVSENEVLITALIMVVNAILVGLQRFPEGVLNGSNLGFKSVYVRLTLLILSGLFSYYVLLLGYGLIGLATVQLITTVLLTISYLFVVTKNVSWFGAERPTFACYRKMLGTSFWFFLWSIVNFGLLQIEVLLLGVFATVEDVSKFVVTFYAIQMVTVIISTVIAAILPGIGKLIGKNEFRRVQLLREESAQYCLWIGVSLSVAIIMVNNSFVSLWVGENVFAGKVENVLIILLALQLVMLKNDSLLINLALEQKDKVKVTVFSIVLVVIFSSILIPKYGIIGGCIAALLGRSILMIYYPKIINKFLNVKRSGNNFNFRVVICSSVLLLFSSLIADTLLIKSWFNLVTLAGSIFVVTSLIYYIAAFSKPQKLIVRSRFKKFVNSFG